MRKSHPALQTLSSLHHSLHSLTRTSQSSRRSNNDLILYEMKAKVARLLHFGSTDSDTTTAADESLECKGNCRLLGRRFYEYRHPPPSPSPPPPPPPRARNPFHYHYLPPGCIRLLTPSPRKINDGYHWKIHLFHFEAFFRSFEYDALSYVWGTDSELLDISLNGRIAKVHRNLYNALPYLARRGGGKTMRPIWIDAICINQSNPGEKMSQIRLMNHVYQNASKVWIWLGTSQHQERIPAAICFLENLRDVKSSQPHRDIDDLYEKLSFATLDEKPALSHLVFNDWFERLWVLQEAALAKEPTFLCGDNECSWQLMEDAMRDEVLYRLFEKECYKTKNLAHLCDNSVRTGTRRAVSNTTVFHVRSFARHGWGIRYIRPSGPDTNSKGTQIMMLAFAIIMSRPQVCLRPEDHVLGLLGLMNPKYLVFSCLDPDVPYVSVEELFTRVTKFILEIASDREIGTFWTWISWACALDRRQGLPSWAPNLSSPGSNNTPRDYDPRSPSRYTTIGKLQRWYPSFIKQDQLKLAGKVLDEVVEVFAQMPFSYSTRDAPRPEQRGHLLAIAHWESTIADVAIGHTSTRPRAEGGDDGSLEEYWRTLVDNLQRYQDETITYDWYLDFQAMGRRLRDTNFNPTCLK